LTPIHTITIYTLPPSSSSFYPPALHLPSFPTRRSSDLFGYFKVDGTGLRIGLQSFVEIEISFFVFLQHQIALTLYEKPVSLGLRSEEHTSELQSRENLVCRLLLEKKKNSYRSIM